LKFGASIANAGDVNADGFADLLIGAPEEAGQAYIVYGGPAQGFAAGHAPSMTKLRPQSLSALAAFGTAVAGVFDVNGDGFTDVLVGAPTADTPGRANDGAVFLFYGGDAGLDIQNPTTLMAESDYGAQAFGRSVAGLSDVDGDGHPDILIGGPGFTPNPLTSAVGRALFLTGPSPNPVTALTLSEGGKTCQFAYAAKGATDLNGDGYSDLTIGSPYHCSTSPAYNAASSLRGKISIWFGGPDLSSKSDVTIDGPDGMGGRFGF
jgi:hypothetical protein